MFRQTLVLTTMAACFLVASAPAKGANPKTTQNTRLTFKQARMVINVLRHDAHLAKVMLRPLKEQTRSSDIQTHGSMSRLGKVTGGLTIGVIAASLLGPFVAPDFVTSLQSFTPQQLLPMTTCFGIFAGGTLITVNRIAKRWEKKLEKKLTKGFRASAERARDAVRAGHQLQLPTHTMRAWNKLNKALATAR